MANETLRTNLLRLIEADGRSRRAISRAAGLGESAVKHILNGHDPGIGTLTKLAAVLNVSVTDITGLDRAAPPLERKPGELVEDQAELYLLGYWRALDEGERGYLLNLIRKSGLGR